MRWWWLCAWFVLFWGTVLCWVPQAVAAQAASSEAVSYTHLTLPTNREV